MLQFVNDFIKTQSFQFYICQVIVILALELYGLLFVRLIKGKGQIIEDLLLAFPISIALYSLSGYFLLSAGIYFSKYSIIAVMVLILAAAGFFFRKNNGLSDKKIKLTDVPVKYIAVGVVVVTAAALISTSGIFRVSATNDSMYFFQEYPRALIHYGRLNHHLDNFLTDASQGISILGTLPFFFGFDEIYGIMAFLNIDFACIFAYAVYCEAKKRLNPKTSSAAAAISVLMLASSMPFVIMARWFMANMFFMEYMFMVVYLAYSYINNAGSDKGVRDISGNNTEISCRGNLVILSILITGLSIMRMEGALTAGFLVLCIMMLEYRNRDIAFYLVLPMFVLQALYLFRIFVLITLFCGYQFMTKQKAVILLAFLAVIMFYALIIRNRILVKIQKYYSFLLIGGLVALNILVFFYDRGDYATNLKAFAANVLKNSGWGLFASFVIGVLILIPVKSVKINYFDITVICYILLTVVTGWARGDNLYESFGDSGNRILIQVVPIMLFALIIKVIEGLEYWKLEKSDLME